MHWIHTGFTLDSHWIHTGVILDQSATFSRPFGECTSSYGAHSALKMYPEWMQSKGEWFPSVWGVFPEHRTCESRANHSGSPSRKFWTCQTFFESSPSVQEQFQTAKSVLRVYCEYTASFSSITKCEPRSACLPNSWSLLMGALQCVIPA